MQELSVGRSVKHSKGPSTYSVQVKEKDLIYCWSWMLFSSSTLCQCVPVRHINQHLELRSLLPLSPGHPSVPQGKACSRAAMMQTLNDFVGADMGDVDRYVLKQGSTMVGGISRTVPKRPVVPSREQTKIPRVLQTTTLDAHEDDRALQRAPDDEIEEQELIVQPD